MRWVDLQQRLVRGDDPRPVGLRPPLVVRSDGEVSLGLAESLAVIVRLLDGRHDQRTRIETVVQFDRELPVRHGKSRVERYRFLEQRAPSVPIALLLDR